MTFYCILLNSVQNSFSLELIFVIISATAFELHLNRVKELKNMSTTVGCHVCLIEPRLSRKLSNMLLWSIWQRINSPNFFIEKESTQHGPYVQTEEASSFSMVLIRCTQMTQKLQKQNIVTWDYFLTKYVQLSLSPPIKCLVANPATNWNKLSCIDNKSFAQIFTWTAMKQCY